jgi:hypothetical protein
MMTVSATESPFRAFSALIFFGVRCPGALPKGYYKSNSLGRRPKVRAGQGCRALKARNDDRFGYGVAISRLGGELEF